MTSAITFTTFTSKATQQQKVKQPRNDYRVIFTDKVRHPVNKVWCRDDDGSIQKSVKGDKLFDRVLDEERMLQAPRKIFSCQGEYANWKRRQESDNDRYANWDIEDEEPDMEEFNSELIRE